MNEYFCHHPWVGLDINNNGDLKPCCKFLEDSNDWQLFNVKDGIDNYVNSEHLKKIKQKFLNGEKPDACSRCWKDEAVGYPSKRQIDYKNWNKQLDSYDLESNDFLFLALPLGNFCNLKCRICRPAASTTWIKEYQDLYNKKSKIQDWHKNSSIWKNIIEYSQSSLEIHIHGGEPFLYDSDEQLELLQSLVDSGKSKEIRIHYNTNCTVFPKQEYWNLWKNFKLVDIQPSIDDIEDRFEYNRYPAKWKTVEENLLKYRNYIIMRKNMQLSISTTVSVFTIAYLEEFFDWIKKNKLPEPYLGRLEYPYYYQVNVLPNNVREKIKNKLEISRYDSLIKIANWLSEDNSVHWNKFLEITKLHDRYRKENAQEIFDRIF